MISMTVVGLFKGIIDNKMIIFDPLFSEKISVEIDCKDIDDHFFNLLCSIDENQIIKIDYDIIDNKNKLCRLYFLK